MTYEISHCRSCGAPMAWVKTTTKAGVTKAMPVNADEAGDPLLVAGGNLVPTGVIDPNGSPFVQYVQPDPAAQRMVSHFATCPQSKKWRR